MSASSASTSTPRVALIEDQTPVREALARLFASSGEFVVGGAYASIEDALPRLSEKMADVLLVDLGLPGVSGMEGIRLFRTRWPSLVLLVLTVHDENEYIFEALCAGADGYLLKSTQPRDLLSSVHQAIAGGAPMSPGVAAKVIRLFRDIRPRPQSTSALTPHEMRILNLLANGENYKTTAAILKVSVNTISFHVRSIYSKLHVHSRSDAVAKAIRRGLIS